MNKNGEENKLSNSLGTGLGLWICKGLTEKMNLKLYFKSEYSTGSSFGICIP